MWPWPSNGSGANGRKNRWSATHDLIRYRARSLVIAWRGIRPKSGAEE